MPDLEKSNIPLGSRNGEDVTWQRSPSIEALVETVVSVLKSPRCAFATMRRLGGSGNALGFLTASALMANAGALIEIYLLRNGLSRFETDGNRILDEFGMALMVSLCWALVIATVGGLVWAMVCHAILLVCDSDHAGFQTTYRLVAFGFGSTLMVMLIPFVGPLIAFWALPRAFFYGFLEAHEAGGAESALAAALSIACAGCSLVPIFLIAQPEFMNWLFGAAQ